MSKCNITKIYGYTKYTNIRKTFLCIGIPRNTDDSLCSGTKLLLPSWLLGFRHEERETQFLLCWLFVQRQLSTYWPNKRARIPQQTTGRASPRFESQLASSILKSQLTAFFKIPKNHSPSLPGITPFTSPVLFLSGVFIMTSVIVTSSPRQREHLHSMCSPTRSLNRKVLSLTKPKDKI